MFCECTKHCHFIQDVVMKDYVGIENFYTPSWGVMKFINEGIIVLFVIRLSWLMRVQRIYFAASLFFRRLIKFREHHLTSSSFTFSNKGFVVFVIEV